VRELQLKLIYAMVVAGKNAKFANKVMKKLFDGREGEPFDIIRKWIEEDKLYFNLCLAKSGNYMKLAKGLRQLVESDIDLTTCTPQDLEEIHGIGQKSSRFFVVWTRPEERYAVLDVHILRWLSEALFYQDVPRSTPSGKAYLHWEEVFIREADARGKTPRELDLELWLQGSGEPNEIPDGVK